MSYFMDLLCSIIDAMDKHEGVVAMLGIAVTVFIFIREVSNNYFTMERDNFNDIFKEPIMRELPEKLSMIDEAKDSEWQDRFEELSALLYRVLEKSTYYKYSIPFFYRCLQIRVGEIEALSRHPNWRLYRSPEKQNRLIQKRCRLMIRNIHNASKGRVFAIKCFQNQTYQWIRRKVSKDFIDRPIDRIVEKYIPGELSAFNLLDRNGMIIETDLLKNMKDSYLIVRVNNTDGIQLISVNCIEKGKMFFGYRWNIRWGKSIGATEIKAKRDNTVRITHKKNEFQLQWNDTSFHKIVLMWYENGNRKHIHFKELSIRKTA